MLQVGALLILLAVLVQSLGKVLYGTFIAGDLTQWFILVSMTLTAAVFLVGVQLRMPSRGRGLMALANIWTAISFIGLFFALKHMPPAMFAGIEIGVSLLVAVAITAVRNSAWPPLQRGIVCAGILLGCGLLVWAELAISMAAGPKPMLWVAIAAATVTGLTSALTTTTCRRLATIGWSSRAVLAHRFYLTILVAGAWLAHETPQVEVPAMADLGSIAAIGVVGVLLPLLLFQVALRRVEEVTVMICGATQPIISFLLALPSPAYGWNPVTFFGVVLITLFVAFDIAAQRRVVVAIPKLA